MLSNVSMPPTPMISGSSGHVPSALRRSSSASMRVLWTARISRTLGTLAYAQMLALRLRLVGGRENFDQQNRLGHHQAVRWRGAGDAQVRDTEIPVGADPGDDAGFGEHPARALLREQMVAQQGAEFVLNGAMCLASWCHRHRFAVDQLPGPSGRIAWVPGHELVQSHPCRGVFAEGNHAGKLARNGLLVLREHVPATAHPASVRNAVPDGASANLTRRKNGGPRRATEVAAIPRPAATWRSGGVRSCAGTRAIALHAPTRWRQRLRAIHDTGIAHTPPQVGPGDPPPWPARSPVRSVPPQAANAPTPVALRGPRPSPC